MSYPISSQQPLAASALAVFAQGLQKSSPLMHSAVETLALVGVGAPGGAPSLGGRASTAAPQLHLPFTARSESPGDTETDSSFALSKTGSDLSFASADSFEASSPARSARDRLNNREVSSCFETAVSLVTLTNPPHSSVATLNSITAKLGDDLQKLLVYARTNPEVAVSYKGKQVKIIDVLNSAIVKNMNPKGVFLGRYTGAGWSENPVANLEIVIGRLIDPTADRDTLLLKIFALSFGYFVYLPHAVRLEANAGTL